MVALRLTARDRETLSEKARSSADAREARRALALLDLDAGEPPTRVARRYRVGRSTIYEWAARWGDAGRPRGERLRDAERPGRPPAARPRRRRRGPGRVDADGPDRPWIPAPGLDHPAAPGPPAAAGG
jgi:hypothetical protein